MTADIAELRKLLEKATPGEWFPYEELTGKWCLQTPPPPDWGSQTVALSIGSFTTKDNAVFVWQVRLALPALLDEIESLRSRSARLEEALRKICEPITVAADADTVSACQDLHEIICDIAQEAIARSGP